MRVYVNIKILVEYDDHYVVTIEVFKDYQYRFTLHFDQENHLEFYNAETFRNYIFKNLRADFIQNTIGKLYLPEEIRNVASFFFVVPKNMLDKFENYVKRYFESCFDYLNKLNSGDLAF